MRPGPAVERRFPLIDVLHGVIFGTTLLLYPGMPGAPRMYVSEVFKVVGGKILFIDNIGLMMRDAQTTGFQHRGAGRPAAGTARVREHGDGSPGALGKG